MLATNFDHSFLLDNGEGNHVFLWRFFLVNVGHLGKVLR